MKTNATFPSWNDLVKRTVARFARNASARQGRILLPEEGAKEHKLARMIAHDWKLRAMK
jgi:hypothetical protein